MSKTSTELILPTKYKRDGDVEFHNPREPFTNHCPLIPGQTVNELHIPRLVSSAFLTETSSSGASSGLTMDLARRWRTPQPPKRIKQLSLQRALTQNHSRDTWLRDPLNRLQTAVVEHVVTGLRCLELNEPKSKPQYLPFRQTRTADRSRRTSISLPSRSQSVRNTSSTPKASSSGACSRSRSILQDFQSARPSSSRIFVNPFDDSGSLDLRQRQDISPTSTRPQTWMPGNRPGSVESEQGHDMRPVTAPHSTTRKRELVTLFKQLPQRSKTQVYRTNPNNKWRRGQVYADALKAEDSPVLYTGIPTDTLFSDRTPVNETRDADSLSFADTPLSFSCPSASVGAVTTQMQTFRLPSPIHLPLPDREFTSTVTAPEQRSGSARYVSEHDVWTPIISPSKSQFAFQAKIHTWNSRDHPAHPDTPASSACSLPLTGSQPNGGHFINGVVPSSASAHTRPWHTQADIAKHIDAFTTSQETIRAMSPSRSSRLSRSSSLSIGALAFERDDDMSHENDGSGFGDLTFLTASVS